MVLRRFAGFGAAPPTWRDPRQNDGGSAAPAQDERGSDSWLARLGHTIVIPHPRATRSRTTVAAAVRGTGSMGRYRSVLERCEGARLGAAAGREFTELIEPVVG
jgi:hypothetical protein